MDRRHEVLTCVAEDVQGRSWSSTHRWEVSLHKIAARDPIAGLIFDAFMLVAAAVEVHRHKATSRVRRARCFRRIGRAVGLGLVLSLLTVLPSLRAY